MRRPSFQFYPGDWSANPNLKRCTFAEKGIWLEVMCLMHDQEQYGVLRWPLKEIAQAVGCKPQDLQELARKGVLKGSDDTLTEAFVYVPRSGRKDGEPVTLIDTQAGPIWYSSRMVKDEHVRTIRAEAGGNSDASKDTPKQTPKGGIGAAFGPRGSSSSSSTSVPTSGEVGNPRKRGRPPSKTAMPADFVVSERVRLWAAEKGFDRLDEHLDAFRRKAAARSYTYADWDAAFMEAVREDWAKLRVTSGSGAMSKPDRIALHNIAVVREFAKGGA